LLRRRISGNANLCHKNNSLELSQARLRVLTSPAQGVRLLVLADLAEGRAGVDECWR
jgi:hypothetical protein